MDYPSQAHHFARTGHTKELETGIAHTDYPYLLTKNGDTLLHSAVQSGQAETTSFLLSCGLSPNRTNDHGFTPLHLAVQQGKIELAEKLLQAGALINKKTKKHRRTALHIAAFTRNRQMTKFLLDRGAPIDEPDKQGKTALRLAADKQTLDCMRLLTSYGADTYSECKRQLTPRNTSSGAISRFFKELPKLNKKMHAVINKLYEIIRDPFIEDPETKKRTPLTYEEFVVCKKETWQQVFNLLGQGAQVNCRGHRGDTPLHRAILTGYKPLIYTLLCRAADLTLTNKKGESPLDCAFDHFLIEPERPGGSVLQMLMHAGTPIAEQLWHYTQQTQRRKAEELVTHSNNLSDLVNTSNEDGQTALHLAAHGASPNIVYTFLKYGANQSRLNNMGLSPRDIAHEKLTHAPRHELLSRQRICQLLQMAEEKKKPIMIDLID